MKKTKVVCIGEALIDRIKNKYLQQLSNDDQKNLNENLKI